MVYYLILFVLYFVISIYEMKAEQNNDNKLALSCVCFFPMYLLTAFRNFSVGTDTFTYLDTFNFVNSFSSLKTALGASRMEPGYVLLNYIVGNSGGSFLTLQIIISTFIYLSFVYFVAKYSNNIGLTCVFFLILRLFCGPMNVVRTWIAISILLFSITSIERRNGFQFLV